MPALGGINGDRYCQKAADEMSLEPARRRDLDIVSAHVGESHERGGRSPRVRVWRKRGESLA